MGAHFGDVNGVAIRPHEVAALVLAKLREALEASEGDVDGFDGASAVVPDAAMEGAVQLSHIGRIVKFYEDVSEIVPCVDVSGHVHVPNTKSRFWLKKNSRS